MKDRVFCDSNIFIYPIARDEKAKRMIATTFLKNIATQFEIMISTQVLNEVANVAIKKGFLDKTEIPNYLDVISLYVVSPVTLETIKKAVTIKFKYQLSFYDALIISSALENNCTAIYTEDLNNGQSIEGLKIINPFTA